MYTGYRLACKQPEGQGVQPPCVYEERKPAATSPRRVAPHEKSINSHLESGRAARYSGRMFISCTTAAPTRHPPGEAHSLHAPALLMTTFAAGPLPVSRASKVASRRLAAHPICTRHPLSSPLSPSATPQLQPAQPLRACVAQNASGDTRRHAGCHWRVASEKRRHGVAIDWPASNLKNRASSPLRLMENACLGGAAARGPIKRRPVARGPVAPPVVTHASNDDAPTPTRPTSSVLCRPKRSRRHRATRDTIRAPC